MINKVKLFGERCSGTNYLNYLIETNFNVKLLKREFGHKHGNPKIEDMQKTSTDNILFVCIFRNPYDWVCSMKTKKYSCSESLFKKHFDAYIRSEWSGETLKDYHYTTESDFSKSIKKPFKNIVDLRNHRNEAFLNLQKYVENFKIINYDNIRETPTKLVSILERHGITLKDKFTNPSQYITHQSKFIDKKMRKNYPIDKKNIEFINENLNWDIENKLGFYKREK